MNRLRAPPSTLNLSYPPPGFPPRGFRPPMGGLPPSQPPTRHPPPNQLPTGLPPPGFLPPGPPRSTRPPHHGHTPYRPRYPQSDRPTDKRHSQRPYDRDGDRRDYKSPRLENRPPQSNRSDRSYPSHQGYRRDQSDRGTDHQRRRDFNRSVEPPKQYQDGYRFANDDSDNSSGENWTKSHLDLTVIGQSLILNPLQDLLRILKVKAEQRSRGVQAGLSCCHVCLVV